MDKRFDIEQLVAEAQVKAIKAESDERAAGKILEDNPIARLLSPLRVPTIHTECFLDDVLLIGNMQGLVTLALGKTTYLTTRRMWPAYKTAVQIACGDEKLLYELFHVVPGTASLVERGDTILLGVRSASLAGTHAGMVSLPAGLMEVEEAVIDATRRELREETSIIDIQILATAAANNPDAPNMTFVTRMQTRQENVSETYEAKGKRFFWMPRDVVLEAVGGNTDRLAHEFQERGVSLDSCRIAPDILSGIKQLYGLYQSASN